MRALCVLILAVAFPGCAMTVAESVPNAKHAKSYAVHMVPTMRAEHALGSGDDATPVKLSSITSADSGAVTVRSGAGVASIMTTALNLPSALDDLRHELGIFTIVLGSIVLLNVALMAFVLMGRRAQPDADGTELPAVPGESRTSLRAGNARWPLVTTAPAASTKSALRCSCGAFVSSRNAQCRRCERTRDERLKLRHADLPSTLYATTYAATIDDTDEEPIEAAHAVLTSSVLGEHKAYYSLVKP